jgi:hypothetical protein
MVLQKVENAPSPSMGEGWGEGEWDVILVAYVPLPFAPLLPPPTSGGG